MRLAPTFLLFTALAGAASAGHQQSQRKKLKHFKPTRTSSLSGHDHHIQRDFPYDNIASSLAAPASSSDLQARQPNGLLDGLNLCISIPQLVASVPLLGLLLDANLCLCLRGLDIYLKTGAKLQLGGLLNSLVKVAINDHEAKCPLPPHSQRPPNTCGSCGFTCDLPYVLGPKKTNCVCPLPLIECNGVCGQFPKGCASAVPRLAARRENPRSITTYAQAKNVCGHATVCGVSQSSVDSASDASISLPLYAFTCVDQTSLENCGGCITPHPFSDSSSTFVAQGKDCNDLRAAGAVSYSCQNAACVVHSCRQGMKPGHNGETCISTSRLSSASWKRALPDVAQTRPHAAVQDTKDIITITSKLLDIALSINVAVDGLADDCACGQGSGKPAVLVTNVRATIDAVNDLLAQLVVLPSKPSSCTDLMTTVNQLLASLTTGLGIDLDSKTQASLDSLVQILLNLNLTLKDLDLGLSKCGCKDDPVLLASLQLLLKDGALVKLVASLLGVDGTVLTGLLPSTPSSPAAPAAPATPNNPSPPATGATDPAPLGLIANLGLDLNGLLGLGLSSPSSPPPSPPSPPAPPVPATPNSPSPATAGFADPLIVVSADINIGNAEASLKNVARLLLDVKVVLGVPSSCPSSTPDSPTTPSPTDSCYDKAIAPLLEQLSLKSLLDLRGLNELLGKLLIATSLCPKSDAPAGSIDLLQTTVGAVDQLLTLLSKCKCATDKKLVGATRKLANGEGIKRREVGDRIKRACNNGIALDVDTVLNLGSASATHINLLGLNLDLNQVLADAGIAILDLSGSQVTVLIDLNDLVIELTSLLGLSNVLEGQCACQPGTPAADTALGKCTNDLLALTGSVVDSLTLDTNALQDLLDKTNEVGKSCLLGLDLKGTLSSLGINLDDILGLDLNDTLKNVNALVDNVTAGLASCPNDATMKKATKAILANSRFGKKP